MKLFFRICNIIGIILTGAVSGYSQGELQLMNQKAQSISPEMSKSPTIEFPKLDTVAEKAPSNVGYDYEGNKKDFEKFQRDLESNKKKNNKSDSGYLKLERELFDLKKQRSNEKKAEFQKEYDNLRNQYNELSTIANKLKKDGLFGDYRSNYKYYPDTNTLKVLLEKERNHENYRLERLDANRKKLDELNNDIHAFIVSDIHFDTAIVLNEKIKTGKELVNKSNDVIKQVNDERTKIENLTKLKRNEDSVAKENGDKNFGVESLISAIVPISSAQLIPNINIKASRTKVKNYENGSASQFSANLFLGVATPSFSDTQKVSTTNTKIVKNLWIPEASTFGVRLKYVASLVNLVPGNNRMESAYLIEVNFLSKSVPILGDTQKIVGTNYVDFAHIKTGLMFNLVKNIFDVHGNLNFLSPVDKISEFNNYFGTKDQPHWFWVDFGFTANLQIAKTDNNILFSLDMIVNSSLQNITKVNDAFIPVMKIAYRPDFK